MEYGQKIGKQKPVRTENGQEKLLQPSTPITPEADVTLPGTSQPRLYRRRWFIVILFASYSLSNAYQWIHLNIIGNVILRYYNESLPDNLYGQETALDWLSMVYMLAYIPLIFPSTWLLDKKGLRVVACAGSLLNCIGAWLKCASVSTDRFALLMFAQTICAIAQIFILGIPARLAAVWFGPNEVSTATAIGVFGNQVGVAVGFLLPPELVPNSANLDQVGSDLSVMFYGTAIVTTVLFFTVLLVFKPGPPHPPSRAQMLAVEAAANQSYLPSLLRLLKNKGFLLLVLTYGLNTGSYYAIGTLLNPVILYYFPDEEVNAGRIGLTLVLAGVLGSIVAGIWLDRTKTFKGTTVAIYLMSMAGMIAFTFTMDLGHLWVVFITAGSLGFFMTGYLPVGFEFAAEITFPESEGTSSGLLNASAQTFGIILTIGMRTFMNKVGVMWANCTVSGALLLGALVTALIRADYRRQRAGEQSTSAVNMDIEIKEKNGGQQLIG